VGVALLIFLPNLLWQIQHNFIAVDYLSSIHARDIQWGRTDSYLPDQLYITTNPFTLPLWIMGLIFCSFAPAGRRFRPLAWMFLTTFLLLLVNRGRSYYLAPAYPMLLAAGATWLENWLDGLRQPRALLMRSVLGSMLTVGAVVAALLTKPVAPIHSWIWEIASQTSDVFVEMVGWPELAQQVAEVYAKLPADEKAVTAILAGNYGEVGALELYGPELGLPRVISGANSLWERGYGHPAPETVIVVGFERQQAGRYFASCQAAGVVSNPYRVNNEESMRHSVLLVCRQPRQPWHEMWPTMRWFQ
jgi:hypothetical protein